MTAAARIEQFVQDMVTAIRHNTISEFKKAYRSLDALLDLVARHPGALLIAGGTDVMVEVNQRHLRPSALISLAAVAELGELVSSERELVIGAGVTLSRLERALEAEGRGDTRMLSELLPLFSSRLIRNRATLGGNLATASPIGDAPPVLLALDAEAPWKRAVPLLLLAVVAVRNAGNFRMPPVVDFHWSRYAERIERGEQVDVAIYPAGWGMTVAPRGPK